MRLLFGLGALLAISFPGFAQTPSPKLQVLLIPGQNGHDWRATTPVLRHLLEETGRFHETVALTPGSTGGTI